MRINDLLWLSYKDLTEKKVRTVLTILMVTIGVASIVALTSLTGGISASVQASLNTLGPTSIILTSSKGFTVTDTSQLSSLPNVSAVIPVVEGSGYVLANGQNTSVTVVGISTQGLQELLSGINLYQGSLFQDSISPLVDVGQSIAFPTSTAGGQNLRVGYPATLYVGGRGGQSVTVSVVGILQSYSSLIVPINTAVVMSLSAAQLLLHRSTYSLILVKAANTSDVSNVAQLITNIYGSSVSVTTTQQIAQTASSIIGSITTLLVIIAGISLLVAAIGIMNIMLISVYERTHDIGIFKAVGFKSSHILLIFLTQALIIGVAGGIVGIGVGAGASYGLSYISSHASSGTNSTTTGTAAPSGGFSSGAGGGARASGGGGAVFVTGGSRTTSSTSSSTSSLSFSPVFSPETIILAILVAVIVSAIAGVYPAWRASRLEPIEALRQL